MEAESVGTVRMDAPRGGRIVVDLSGSGLRLGDQLHIIGPWDDVRAEVVGLEVGRDPVADAERGELVGLAVREPVHRLAQVWRLRVVDPGRPTPSP